MIRKIVIIGPESTGKSTLCEQLATHYHTEWCREYAREYLLKNGMDYSYEDLLTIAKGQLELEDEHNDRVSEMSAENKPFPSFIDTDMYVMKVWCEFVFQKCHRFILDQIVSRQYHLYLLCSTDLEWVKDELREYPDLESRERLYKMYHDIMVNQSVPWVEISGDYDQRLQKAITAVDEILKK